MHKTEAQQIALNAQGEEFEQLLSIIKTTAEKGLFELDFETLSEDHATALDALGYFVINRIKFDAKAKGFFVSWR